MKLKALGLNSAEMLSSEQLKSSLRAATGGSNFHCSCPGGGGCTIWCESTADCVEICRDYCNFI